VVFVEGCACEERCTCEEPGANAYLMYLSLQVPRFRTVMTRSMVDAPAEAEILDHSHISFPEVRPVYDMPLIVGRSLEVSLEASTVAANTGYPSDGALKQTKLLHTNHAEGNAEI